MKISYNWLKDLVKFDATPQELSEKLTMVGLAVDAVEQIGDDYVLELDLTSNRPDCLSHLGVARDTGAIFDSEASLPEYRHAVESKEKCNKLAKVEILNPELCPRYTARIIRGVKIGPSPEWLVKRLEAMGQRSVNNIADITNYVMLETGQPLHAFDLHELKGQSIIVRTAKDKERITTLDGEERELTSQMLVIADAERAVALGGIKGGEDSGITDKTTDVLLEAAYFTPAQVRATAKALDLSTEASYRFERGTDPEIPPVASAIAAAMMHNLAGGEVLSGIIDVYPSPVSKSPIKLRIVRYKSLIGLDVEINTAATILQRLGFKVKQFKKEGYLLAEPPTWRTDISIEEDLIEEVARIIGYGSIKSSLPGNAGAGAYLEFEERRITLRESLMSSGFHEAISFSFVNVDIDKLFSAVDDSARWQLMDPIDETQSHMRTTMLGGLIKSLDHNFNHGMRNVRLFELGKCFSKDSSGNPFEIEKLGIVATGARNENDWNDISAKLDFFDFKGIVEAVLERIGILNASFLPVTSVSCLHPGRAAIISGEGGQQELGVLGQLHPNTASQFKFKQPVFIAELDLALLFSAKRFEARYKPLQKFPTVIRDLALLIDKSVSYSSIRESILELAIPELTKIDIFDLYEGKELPTGKHSIALSICYRSDDRTLTDEEVNKAHSTVIKQLTDRFNAELR